MISEEFLKRAQNSFGYKSFFKEEELKKLEECAGLISKEIESTGHVRPLLEYLLSLILPETAEGKEKPLNKVIDYVKMYFRESPTIADAAKVACLSPAYFGNLFKNTYGVSFNTYVNRKKVEFAKILLANDMNVTEACFESGFNSLSSFLKVFKKETGVAPKEYQINERRKNITE
jgi:AraC-like DNA-binding protein